MENIRIYVLYAFDGNYGTEPINMTDEQFIQEAEKEGLVWSVNGFEKQFNSGLVSDNWYIRFINIKN